MVSKDGDVPSHILSRRAERQVAPQSLNDRQVTNWCHKDGAEFSRVHKAGWDKVIPTQWMEDQISDAFSVTDEERSVYSQDNGEEEAKKKLTSQLTSVINDNGFLAGEMTPFEPETVSHGHADAQCHSDRAERGVEARQLKAGPRWPFEGSTPTSQPTTLTYTSTCSPVQHWLSSVRPPLDIRPASLAVHNNEAPVKVRANPGLSLQQPGHSETLHRSSEKTSTSDFTRARPSKLNSRDKAVPTPACEPDRRFLTPRPPRIDSLRRSRAPTSPIATIPEEGADHSYNPPAEISPRSQYSPLRNHPLPLSINPTSTPCSSSWSTILCTDSNDSDSNSNVTLTQTRIHDATPLPTNRPSDKNKPLPLLPDEPTTASTSTSPRGPETEAEENYEKRDSLTDTIDQVLDLYYRPDSESDDHSDEHDQSALIRPGSSCCCSTSTLTLQPSSYEPSGQAPHTPATNTDTDVTFMLMSGGSSSRFTPPLTPTRTSASTPASTPMIFPGRGSLKARDSDPDSDSDSASDSALCPHSHFVKSYPIFYDGMSYPELGRGSSWDGRERGWGMHRVHRHQHQALRQDERQGEYLDRETHIRWSGSAVVTFVDHTGRTWI